MDHNLNEADPAVAALARMLIKEDWTSDLIAFLAALDPWPLLRALDLDARDPSVVREKIIVCDGRQLRPDLMVYDGDQPRALLEVKISAAEHGGQFNDYLGWANDKVPAVSCYLLCLDHHAQNAPEGWSTGVSLPELLRLWRDSDHPHAGWLASSAANVLEEWIVQSSGKIGLATYGGVPNLLVRQLAVEFSRDVAERLPGLWQEGRGDHIGHASFIASLPYPIEPNIPGALICVDFRSGNTWQTWWTLRLAVQVTTLDQARTGDAKMVAHDLGMAILESLKCDALQNALREKDKGDLAALIEANPYGGIKRRQKSDDDAIRAEWRAIVFDPDTTKRQAHPILYNDNLKTEDDHGVRLASSIWVKVVELDRCQLLDLLVVALDHLNDSAASATVTLSPQGTLCAVGLAAADDAISVPVTSAPDDPSDLAGSPPDGPAE